MGFPKQIKKNIELDDEFMKTFEEVDQKCKAFLVMSPNKTPEERDDHEKKIKKWSRSKNGSRTTRS